MDRASLLRRRIRTWSWIFIAGLLFSGVTAIPLQTEVDRLVEWSGAAALTGGEGSSNAPEWAAWLIRVQSALHDTASSHPFLFYGTDWLAFGHFMIALTFVGVLRDPVRNKWLFDFGVIACALVIPYALVFGAVRGIPVWWRLIDCSFGVLGFVPLWLCRKWVKELENL